ncbi:MAG: hypothetical protein ACSLFQ_03995 [Thermoanaerobaculia bacterium]
MHAIDRSGKNERKHGDVPGLLEWAVLLFVFDGDAASWARWVAEQGSGSQQRDDLELARSLAQRIEGNEPLRLRLRALAQQLKPPPN